MNSTPRPPASPRRLLAISGATAVGVALLVPAAGPAAAAPREEPAPLRLTVVDRDGEVAPGRSVSLAGRVPAVAADRRVQVQQLTAGRGEKRTWRTIRTVRAEGRRFRATVEAPERDLGAYRYRARVAGSQSASRPVRVRVQRPGSGGMVGVTPFNCADAYREHTNFHNICAFFTNDTHTFLSPGVAIGGGANFTNTKFWWDDGGAHHAAAQATSLGDRTWGFTSAQQSYYAQMKAEWDVQTPTGDSIVLDAWDGVGDDASSRCDGGTWTACEMTSDRGWIAGDRLYKLDAHFTNAPLVIQIDNNTGKRVLWRTRPQSNALSLDPAGSSEDLPGATPIEDGDSYYIAAYRQVTGRQALATFSLQFPDANVDGLTHVMNVAAQLTPDTSKGNQPSKWPVNTDGSKCVDRPVGGDSGLQAPCSVDWSGTGQWGGVATMVVTLNNRF